jgi:hypothetical protein
MTPAVLGGGFFFQCGAQSLKDLVTGPATMAATTETVEEFDTSFRNVLAPAKIPRTLVVTEKIPISIGDFVFTPPAAAFTVDVSGENGTVPISAQLCRLFFFSFLSFFLFFFFFL